MTRQKTYFDRWTTKKDKITDLKPFQQRVNVIFKVLKKERSHRIRKNNASVSECLIGDDTGSILLTVWNEDIEMLEQGEYFALYDGYVNIHNSKLKLNKKKFGEIEPALDQGFEINHDNNLSNKQYDETLTLLKTKIFTKESLHNGFNLGQDNVKIVGMDST